MTGAHVDLPLESSERYVVLFNKNANIMNESPTNLDVDQKVFGKWYASILNPFEVKEFVGI